MSYSLVTSTFARIVRIRLVSFAIVLTLNH
ncbi:Uncharacterised protein [Vibrio cholerae]|nr:Uncharacterised protein [Vibrio cholerae]